MPRRRTDRVALIVLEIIAGIIFLDIAGAREVRSRSALHEFRAAHPCPATGKQTGHCQGWIIDHRIALCVGGKDEPANMRWQTFDKSHLKDRWECRADWAERLAQCERSGCYKP